MSFTLLAGMKLPMLNGAEGRENKRDGGDAPHHGNRWSAVVRKFIYYYAPSLILAVLIQYPQWPNIFESIYGHPMIDREVYTNKILYYDLPTDYLPHFDTRMYFTYEWLWNSSLSYLHRELGLGPEQIFSVITTAVLWRFTYEVATRVGWAYVVLLLNPLVIDFAFSQLRLAAAITLLSFFWRARGRVIVTLAAYVVASSIHTAAALFAFMHLAAHWVKESKLSNLCVLMLAGIAISVAIGPLRETILGALGDRRADYEEMSSTLAYSSFWLALWAFLVVRWRTTMLSLDGRYSVIILSLVALNALFGGYSTRFLAAAFPSLVISMIGLRSNAVPLSVTLFVPYTILQWLYWFKMLGE